MHALQLVGCTARVDHAHARRHLARPPAAAHHSQLASDHACSRKPPTAHAAPGCPAPGTPPPAPRCPPCPGLTAGRGCPAPGTPPPAAGTSPWPRGRPGSCPGACCSRVGTADPRDSVTCQSTRCRHATPRSYAPASCRRWAATKTAPANEALQPARTGEPAGSTPA